ncbi:MAG: Crp/Fnr family transcriptional regulator [Limnohabitans sp.]|nr:Crp/Fnr family transcriptional regulator [Limnohabitans sp.]
MNLDLKIFAKSIQNIGTFSLQEIEQIFEYCTFRKVTKNEILLKEGEICKSLYFLLSGAIYQYRVNDIDENAINLHTENQWFLNNSSFISQKPSTETIKAFLNSELLEMTVYSLHKLIELSPVYYQFARVLEPNTQIKKYFDHKTSPIEKYKSLLRYNPEILKVFPLKYIASYLQITPETLSRVRGKL